MPDLATHFLVNYCVKRGLPHLMPRYFAFSSKELYPFLWGALLPDLFSRAPRIGMGMISQQLSLPYPHFFHHALGYFHQPFGYLLLCFLISQFFPLDTRVSIFKNLFLGGLLHYLLDFCQYHLEPAYMPFFPLSTCRMEWGLFSTEASLYSIPFWLALAAYFFWKVPPSSSDLSSSSLDSSQ